MGVAVPSEFHEQPTRNNTDYFKFHTEILTKWCIFVRGKVAGKVLRPAYTNSALMSIHLY